MIYFSNVLKSIVKRRKYVVIRSFSSLNFWNEELSSEIKHKIENHWRQEVVTAANINFSNARNNEKYYVLSMFPYPSGFLHMGHVRVYTISDVIARFQRMNGKNVIHPIGWDAFGLPAENAAIDRNIAPEKWTNDNISHMKKQLKDLGCSFDWDREIATCHPDYYRWTQELFLKLYDSGLVYQKEATVNWDPVDRTVLADEQVDENGCSWRSGAKVEKKLLKQWFIRTTKYAKELLENLDNPILEDWHDVIKLQKHWIGECNGVNFDFKIAPVIKSNDPGKTVISNNDPGKTAISNSDLGKTVIRNNDPGKTVTSNNDPGETVISNNDPGKTFISNNDPGKTVINNIDQVKTVLSNDSFVTFWTDMPEYVEHVKFVLVSESHVLAKKENASDGKTVRLKVDVLNPFNNETVPVYCSNEVEFLPMTDSYLGIPGASEESATFAKKHDIHFTPLCVFENDELLKRAQNDICERAIKLNAGGYWSSAKLRDWLISRQRYWGTPIPIIHCDNCGSVPVPREQLPVELPELHELSRKGGSQLGEISQWVNTDCPKCKSPAKRETDTMDTFVDSSWYFLRYLSPKDDKEMFDRSEAMKNMPVDLYIGGKEHAVLHLYYARFINHFLYYLGLVPEKEPFKRLLVQGMVMGRSFRVKKTGEYLPESRVKIIDLKKNKAVTKDTNEPVTISWEKMSKSKHNGVDPRDMFREYGTDTTRLLILADVSPKSHRNWNSNTFPGIINWQRRLWLTVGDFLKHRHNPPPMIAEDKFKTNEEYLFDSRNYYIKGVTFNYLISQQLSIAVSKQQGLTNSLRKVPPSSFAFSPQFERALAAQLVLLAPMAPHFASELWSGFNAAPNRLNVDCEEIRWDRSVLEQRWPETDWDYRLDLVCQVNGHENCTVKYTRKDLEKLTKDEATHVALNQKQVQETLLKRNILDVTFKIHTGCEGVLNIVTDQPPPVVKKDAESSSAEN